MRIENNKIIFEVVECWDCNGTGKSKRYAPCMNNNMKMRGKTCQYCGTRNQYHNNSETPHYVTCTTCNGDGVRLETRFDSITPEIMQYLLATRNFIFIGTIKEKIDLDKMFISDCYSGRNSFAGCQDYIDHRNDNAEKLLDIIRKNAADRLLQALNYIDEKGNLIKDIVYYGYNGGYAADFKK